MTVYEDLTFALIFVAGAAATAAIYLGALGLLGGLDIVRCASCNHWTLASTDQRQRSCFWCRHTVMTHPLQAVHHSGAVADAARRGVSRSGQLSGPRRHWTRRVLTSPTNRER